jgi:hypothetical protein
MQVRGNNYSITVEREFHEFHVLEETDPNWRFVDASGHVHTYAPDGSVPTVESVSLGTYWCEGCCDEHEDFETRCVRCGERVTPGTRAPSGPTRIPGLTTVTATFTHRFGDYGRIADAFVTGERLDIDLPDANVRLVGARVVECDTDLLTGEGSVTVIAEQVATL